jgi:DNA polymerase-3 subunit beta
MKFTVSSAALNSQLQNLAKIISSKNSLAILDCFLFEVNNGQLTITAGDGENMMKAVISLDESDADGKFVIPHRTILDAVKELPEQPLVFNIDLSTFAINVTYMNGSYNFTAQSGEEYPSFPALEGETSVITINETVLAGNLNRTFFAVAADELHPVMNGVFFDQKEDNLTLVASDGHKLVRDRNFNIKSPAPCSFILPKKPASLLKGILGKQDADVVIRFNVNKAEIGYSGGVIACRLIEGKFPNYEAVIPQNNPNNVTINRKALLSAMRRVLPFASEGSELVRFNLTAGQLELQSEDIDFATSAKESISCEYAGSNMSIGFKGSSIMEILNNLTSEEVTIQLADPSRAGVIVPAEKNDDESVLMLLMPMLLND